jgi:hypothetical protein
MGTTFSPLRAPNLGQRHFPLYEASLLSMRTIELPFMLLSFLFSFPVEKSTLLFHF